MVLVGDPEQLQSIEARAAFRSIAERHGGVEITEIRQREDWRRHLALGRTGEALDAYDNHGGVHAAETRAKAREELVDTWDRDRMANPQATRIILTHTNDEVQALNAAVRARLQLAKALGEDVEVKVERGDRAFANGDRVMFLKNDQDLGVKNGTLGVAHRVSEERVAVRLDDGRQVASDLKDYAQVDHGYAATIHKAQGMTVDRVHVLATPGLDAQSSYVALSRHCNGVDLHYGRDDFADQTKLTRSLSRERVKDVASDDSPAREFAERRDIRVTARETPELKPSRSMFASFKPTLEPKRDIGALSLDADDLKSRVERYARALDERSIARENGVQLMPHQDQARERARIALDQVRPHAARDLEKAFQREPDLIGLAAGGRSNAALRDMALEAEIPTNPQLRKPSCGRK